MLIFNSLLSNSSEIVLDLIAELGQSNMEGRNGDVENVNYPFISNNGFWFDGSIQYNISTDRGGAQGGSHANYFVEKYYSLTKRKPVLLEVASGGRGLTITSSNPHWGQDGGMRETANSLINSALNYYGKNNLKAGLWCQGERDAQEIDSNVNYTKTEVKTAMQDTIVWWQNTYPNTPFLISELGDFSDSRNTQGWQDVRAVQNEIVAENENVFMAFTGAKNFGLENKMVDSLHYNYIGYKEMGEAFAIKLAEIG
jgi:hypothetical protein